MARFIVGLIIGVIVGVVWVAYEPDVGQQVRGTLQGATDTVLRGTEEAAEEVGDAAGEAADGAGEAEQQPEAGTAQ